MRGDARTIAIAAAAWLSNVGMADANPFVWTRGEDEALSATAEDAQAPKEAEVASAISRCRFADMLTAAANDAGLSSRLVIAVAWAETRCRHAGQVSPKGAIGLMQLMPATARRFGAADPTDLDRNIAAGVAYLRWLSDRYDGDTVRIVAAYNAGEGAVDRYGGIPPYAETRAYVASISAALGVDESLPPRRGGLAVARLESPFVIAFDNTLDTVIVRID